MDRLTAEERSRLMSRIRGKDTKPEMAVRRLVHGMGFRYRLHRRDLPGSPDLVLPRHRKVILVHGCFWHSHTSCRAGRVPASNTGYWVPKLRRNVERDAASQEALRLAGPVTAKLCNLAMALQNTRSVKSAGLDPQQNRGFLHPSLTMPNSEMSKDTKDAWNIAACKLLTGLAFIAGGQIAQLRGHWAILPRQLSTFQTRR